MYLLKYYDKLVGKIDEINRSMEIIEPELLFDKYGKEVISGEVFQDWLKSRIRRQWQSGFRKFVSNLGLDINSPDLDWEIFVSTRGVNSKDRLWLALSDKETFEESSPWFLLLNNDLSQDNEIIEIGRRINIGGSSEKQLVRRNGKLFISKEKKSNEHYESIAEKLTSEIGNKLGLVCLRVEIAGDNTYLELELDKDIYHSSNISDNALYNFENIYLDLCELGATRKLKVDLLRLGLFDMLINQTNRHSNNIAFYKTNGILNLFPIYGNEESLFSTRYFSMEGVENSEGLLDRTSLNRLDFICAELKSLKVTQVFPTGLTEDWLTSLFKDYTYDIMFVTNTNVKDIVRWILKVQELLERRLAKSGILLNDRSISIDKIPIFLRRGNSDEEAIVNYKKFLGI